MGGLARVCTWLSAGGQVAGGEEWDVISALTNLGELDVRETSFTDCALLEPLQVLRFLQLDGTQPTSLASLATLANLHVLSLLDCAGTWAGAQCVALCLCSVTRGVCAPRARGSELPRALAASCGGARLRARIAG